MLTVPRVGLTARWRLLENPPAPMPHVLTLTWAGPFTASDTQDAQRAWINVVTWAKGGNSIPDARGVYVIEDISVPAVLYAGKASSMFDRFDGRSGALHDYWLKRARLPNRRVWCAIVVSAPAWKLGVSQAEKWLIRFLARRDAALAPNQYLQNREGLAAYPSPGGVTIEWDQTAPTLAPAYLIDAGAPGYIAHAAGGNWVAYDYPNANMVLP